MIRNAAVSDDLFVYVLDSLLKIDRYYNIYNKRQSLTNILPVYNFSFPFSCNHIQQSLPQVIPNAAIAYNLISKNNQAQIVDILHIILLHIHTVLNKGICSNDISNSVHPRYSKLQEIVIFVLHRNKQTNLISFLHEMKL